MKSKSKILVVVTLMMALLIGVSALAVSAETSAIEVDTLEGLVGALESNSRGSIIITSTIVISEGETVVLDLNGKTVTVSESIGNHTYALNNKGRLLTG